MRPLRLIAALAALALLVGACAGGQESATPAGAVDHDAMDHGDHDAMDHETMDHDDHHDAEPRDTATERIGPGQAQIDAMLALPEDVVRRAHDHSGDHHEHGAAAEARTPSVLPERIVIPAIGVDADVIELGLQDDGTMEVPTDFDQTGWFRPGPRPGRVGPSVIAGHVDSTSGPAVFHDLDQLEPGDRIEVHGDEGDIVTFVVRELQQHPKDEFPTEAVYGGTQGAELRLITCSGDFDRGASSYLDNTIVFAERTDTA